MELKYIEAKGGRREHDVIPWQLAMRIFQT